MTLSPYIAGTLSERGLELPVYVGIALFFAAGVFMLAARGIAPPPLHHSGKARPSMRPRAEDRSTPPPLSRLDRPLRGVPALFGVR